MARIEIRRTFHTSDDARDFMHAVYSNYHPDGYGTTLEVYGNAPTAEASTEFIVMGHRYDSCN
jgi:hypothetical protein